MRKRWFSALAGMSVGLSLCAALVLRFDVQSHDWIRLFHNVSWPWVIAVVTLTVLLWWSGARKWALFSSALHGDSGKEPASGFFLRHFAWQNWLGQFVPPALAIVLGRCWASRRMPGVGVRAGAGSAIYDQAFEFVLLMGLLPAAYTVLSDHAVWFVWVPMAVLGVWFAASAIFLCRCWLPQGIQEHLGALLGWSALRVVLTVVRIIAGAPALGFNIEPAHIVAASPVVAILALIPLTPGNLGLAEWGWSGVLIYAGTASLTAGLFALGFRLLIYGVQTAVLAAQELMFFILKTRKLSSNVASL